MVRTAIRRCASNPPTRIGHQPMSTGKGSDWNVNPHPQTPHAIPGSRDNDVYFTSLSFFPKLSDTIHCWLRLAEGLLRVLVSSHPTPSDQPGTRKPFMTHLVTVTMSYRRIIPYNCKVDKPVYNPGFNVFPVSVI